MAAEKGRFGTVISSLVDKGADINIKDINGVNVDDHTVDSGLVFELLFF